MKESYNLIIVTIVASAVVAMLVVGFGNGKSLSFTSFLSARSGSDVLFDEQGARLTSLFEGWNPPSNRARSRLGLHSGVGCRETTGAWKRALGGIAGSILDPPIVYAQNCVPGICAGAYYTYEWHECPPACFGWFKWHYSDPTVAPADTGWRYNGREGCLWCGGCEEESCFTS